MDCRDAQFYLRLRRHATDELGPDVTGPLDDHLATCPACATNGRVIASFDRAVARAMVAVPVPSRLRSQLLARVAEKRGADLRRKAYRAVAALAASVLFVGIAFGVFTNTRPKVDADALVQRADEQLSDPERSTREWLTAQKLPGRLPDEWGLDYYLVMHRGHEMINSEYVPVYVPVIVFRSSDPRDPTAFAKVYLFPNNGRFDLKNVQDAQASLTTARVVVGQGDLRGVTYVIVHTGGPHDGLKQFRRNLNGPGV
ncbi:hypothetical protein VT84_28980 [Gemmata sp. SH-PL17]|uniref:hypothetical protein n=1 Tax=Gemmata sp. SH-PL17 TaxID=1630693 RepID=UPI00078CD6B7|nr:hypothetical protein [Gemmata sp. SH-PL17]AMV28474.1 hypothetical protein VT84_28980 [Gemmata sp. SH-PL17]